MRNIKVFKVLNLIVLYFNIFILLSMFILSFLSVFIDFGFIIGYAIIFFAIVNVVWGLVITHFVILKVKIEVIINNKILTSVTKTIILKEKEYEAYISSFSNVHGLIDVHECISYLNDSNDCIRLFFTRTEL